MEGSSLADPRIIQGVLTMLAALVASGSALFIAYFIYPKQKEVDKRNDLAAEHRVVYKEFSRSYEDFVSIVRTGKELGDDSVIKFRELRISTHILSFTAPSNVVNAAADVVNALADLAFTSLDAVSAPNRNVAVSDAMSKANMAFENFVVEARKDGKLLTEADDSAVRKMIGGISASLSKVMKYMVQS